MSYLAIEFSKITREYGVTPGGRGWIFFDLRDDCAVAGPFGRLRDAEIAIEILKQMPIDWELPVGIVDHQIKESGLCFRKRMQKITQHLQW